MSGRPRPSSTFGAIVDALLPARRSPSGWTSFALRAALTAGVLRRLAGAAHAAAPVATAAQPAAGSASPSGRSAGMPANTVAAASPVAADGKRLRAAGAAEITVVVPARDEIQRIGPLLERVVGAPGVAEVIVVDDESSDGTARTAAASGARVVRGAPRPELSDGRRWVGKAWALQQGIEAVRTQWVVTLDADTRPDPALPSAAVARADADGLDVLTLAGRFECPTPGVAWLHPAMLTTLVYRFGPPGSPGRAGRELANGQCMVLRRDAFLAAGGMEQVGGEVVEDVALVRTASARGERVGFLDAAELLEVRMFESFGDVARGWGRSLALPGVEPRWRQVADLLVLTSVQSKPLLRVALRHFDVVDVVAVALRLGTLVGTRRAYRLSGPSDRAAYWLSPIADPIALAALAFGTVRGGRQTWRGRTYG